MPGQFSSPAGPPFLLDVHDEFREFLEGGAVNVDKARKEKEEKARFPSVENKREAIAVVILFIGVFFLILTFILWGVSKLTEGNFILSEMMGAYCAASMCLCFGLIFLGMMVGTRNWFGKIVCLLVAAVMMSASYHFLETSILLYKDKAAFENKQFEKLVAIPTGVEYDDPDYGTEYVMELEFDDLTIDIYNLNISRNYYAANFSGKPLEIAYLPNSHFAVSVKEYLGEAME
ncbi:hypothetical protein [Neobacillus vireti]|uniref:Uncharacterized protein n=1 Tax=Neobacillus vireti LMG 21834 TaxID=1131730 RepID=A0AB94IRR5_9BACI|nr:hypothetical protein [Neobacillus vireti]ETI69790.1 hypothetical protein BAVI_05714 [Neobacillus vireti LMG 21834]KLT17853.1 hypothetical protein AA980_12255 [Neobacillus vireti]